MLYTILENMLALANSVCSLALSSGTYEREIVENMTQHSTAQHFTAQPGTTSQGTARR